MRSSCFVCLAWLGLSVDPTHDTATHCFSYHRPAGGIKFEVGVSNETDDTGGDIEFTTGHNPDTSSGAFRVQTADGGREGSSGEISLRTGEANIGNSGAIVIETGENQRDGKGGEFMS